MNKLTWRDMIRNSGANAAQTQQIELLVDMELGKLQAKLSTVQADYARCVSNWSEWLDQMDAGTKRARCSLRGDNG